MTVDGVNDIVMGVVQAADPAKVREAVQRLQRAAVSAGVAAPADFAAHVEAGTSPSKPVAPAPHGSARALPAPLSAEIKRQTESVAQEFEAVVLQTFIQSMLPKSAQSVFGRGTAGEVWKSMLAEMLAKEIAGSGGIGLPGGVREAAQKKQSAGARAAAETARLDNPLRNILADAAAQAARVPPKT